MTGSAGSFVTGDIVSFMFGNAVGLVVFDSFVSGGAGNLASEVAVCLMPECLEYFAEFVFNGHHPSPPLYFTNVATWSPSTFLCLWHFGGMGGCHFLGLWLYLLGDLE